jgi:hypothetical protein
MYRGYAVRYRARTCAQLPTSCRKSFDIFDYRHRRLNTFSNWFLVQRIMPTVPRLVLAYRLHCDSEEPAAGLAGELMVEVQSAEGL